jgi:hypothetical protein
LLPFVEVLAASAGWRLERSPTARSAVIGKKRDNGNIARLADPPGRQSFLSKAAFCFVGHEIIRRFAREP